MHKRIQCMYNKNNKKKIYIMLNEHVLDRFTQAKVKLKLYVQDTSAKLHYTDMKYGRLALVS